MASKDRPKQELLGPIKTKAKALEEEVLFAWDVGVQDVVLESDSKIVVDALIGTTEAPVAIDNIIGGIRAKL